VVQKLFFTPVPEPAEAAKNLGGGPLERLARMP
jgi:hypothetical protein